jgi:hypothetical protein
MIMDEKPPFSFWYQQNRAAMPSVSQAGIDSQAKQFEFGYDAASDMRGNIENLRGLYETGGKATKRIARLALEPLLLAQGVSKYDFDREFPPIAPEPTSMERAALDLKKVNEIIDFVNGATGPPPWDEV